MYKLIIFLLGISVISCSSEPKLLKNGLTKKVSTITEYVIEIQNEKIDTIAVITKYYNQFDEIIKRVQKNTFDNSTIEIDFEYNDFNKIQREMVKVSNDSSIYTIDYKYLDTLLIKTHSESKNNIFHFEQIGKYKYNSNNILEESSTSLVFIDLETNDTTLSTIQIFKYDEKEFVIESKDIDNLNPIANNSTKSEYSNGLLNNIKKYDSENSLISITNYIYEFDKYKNWIKRESFINDKRNYIKTRKIEYK